MKRYKEQQKTVIEIVAKFDEPGADAEGPLSAEEEAKQAERHADIVALVAKVSFNCLTFVPLAFADHNCLLRADERSWVAAEGDYGRDATRCAHYLVESCQS